MRLNGKWITASGMGSAAPEFIRHFQIRKPLRSAVLRCTALGVYECVLNGERVGDFVLAPGWTVYEKRLQVQEYDITRLLRADNTLQALVSAGWYASPLGWSRQDDESKRKRTAFLGEIQLVFQDGSEQIIGTDDNWLVRESRVRFSEIYDGEHYDARMSLAEGKAAEILEKDQSMLIPQEGEIVRETGRVAAKEVFLTPKGELVVDFGQEITGYVDFTLQARTGDKVRILHSEMPDAEGNFYNANYRSAKAEIRYICREGLQTWHPKLTFFGFRYICLDQWPGGIQNAEKEQFTAVVVHSDLRRTGHICTADPKLNQLISNIFWSQRGNFLDVPTDCPQRDERLGWTGDAGVFIKAACYNYDSERFYRKWLADMRSSQKQDGGVPLIVPNVLSGGDFSEGTVAMAECFSAWGDASCICPWQLYESYGRQEILSENFDMMKRWVDYIGKVTQEEDLWVGGEHFGDWLALDAPYGSYKGSSRDAFIASAYYANSVDILVKSGRILGYDMSGYEALYQRILGKFRKTFPECRTQTEYVLSLAFHLAEDAEKNAAELAAKIRMDGQMMTGFLGTHKLLHVLSEYGYSDLAYDLLLRESYPGWLYSVSLGATTVWEHWDGISETGKFWSTDMNSFNHYAYGSVIDWLYEKACGIRPLLPGFEKVEIAPRPDERLGFLEGSVETRRGLVNSRWEYTSQGIRYDITTPVECEFVLNGQRTTLSPGEYTFWG